MNANSMDTKSLKPILSICIPTFNRAPLLKSALQCILPQVKAHSDEVELVISDNASTDGTAEVIEWARQLGPFRYRRNTENIGACRNIVGLTSELAAGEYCWILPDDDIVREDAISRLLSIIKSNSDVDYFFLNVSPRSAESREQFAQPVKGEDYPALEPTKSRDLECYRLDEWEELIDPEIDDVFLGSIMCSIFRLSAWNAYDLKITANDVSMDSLKMTYPHAVVFANTMKNVKAYYIGYPCVITFWGRQEWAGYVPMIYLVRLQELLDLYEEKGVSKWRIDKCRKAILKNSSLYLRLMLRRENIQGIEYFSLGKFIWRNRRHPIMLFRTLVLASVPEQFVRILRRIRAQLAKNVKNVLRLS